MVSISTLPAYAANVVKLPNYSVYKQSGDNCWAYAILSMENYIYGGYSINDVYDAFYYATGNQYKLNDGANVNEALKVMKYIFSGYSPAKCGVLTANEIRMEIDSNFPVYIRGGDINSAGGHAVALMGYRDGGSDGVSMIYYMNSATGKVMYTGYAENSVNTFYTNNSQVYEWENSIIIAG
ncbi:MAG: hypothetical protein K2G83_06380 [Ruminococcus sp.]|nr:hypothetical protein [Ruminococcus sp.]